MKTDIRIQVINPNTDIEMTNQIDRVAGSAASPGTYVKTFCPAHGPESIESHFDEVIASAAVLDCISEGVASGFDAHVIACFGDPGLLAARELARGPVIGIAEAAMHAASFVATRFSIVTSLSRTAIQAEELLLRYGFERHCRRIRAIDLPVLHLADRTCNLLPQITEECRQACEEDNIGAVVLGCAAFAIYASPLSAELGLPVIDGVSTAVRFAEALVGVGLLTSKYGDFDIPPSKKVIGRYAHWSKG